MLDTGGTFINNSIFDSCEADAYHGAKILLRCLIEHFIRSQHLYINWAKSKTDEYAKRYIEFGNVREVLDLIKASVSEQQLYDPNLK